MAKNTAETVFTGDAEGLVAAYQRLREENRKQEQELRELSQAQRAAHREEQQGLRESERMLRGIQTPLEKYRESVSRIEKQYESGNIDLEQRNRLMDQERDRLEENSEATGALDGAFTRLVPTLASVAAGFVKAANAQAQLREETEQTATNIDRLTRNFQVQAGLNALQARDARKKILEVSRDNAVNEETGFAAATQLVSSGFSSPQKSGALDAFLKIVSLSNLAQQDPTALIQGMGQFLEAFGLEKGGQNLLDLGVRGRGLFAKTDVKVADMSAFAKGAPAFAAAGVSLEDTLSTFAILREQMGASEAGVQGRNVLTSLQTMSADNARVKALKSIGLKPTDIDVIGESLPQALGTLSTALREAPEEQRAPILARLFGRENQVGALALLNNIPKYAAFAALQNDKAGFVQGVNVAQSGPNAAANRLAIDRTILLLEKEDEANARSVAQQQLEIEDAENYQNSGLMGGFALGASQVVRDPLIWLGANPARFLSPEGQQNIATAGQSDFTIKDLTQELGGIRQAIQDQTDKQEAQRERPQPVRVENADPRPPAAAQTRMR